MARRPGDVPSLIADPRKAEKVLNWKAKKSIKDIIKDAINSVE
jgi:UDP-glucose 4-epimerase